MLTFFSVLPDTFPVKILLPEPTYSTAYPPLFDEAGKKVAPPTSYTFQTATPEILQVRASHILLTAVDPRALLLAAGWKRSVLREPVCRGSA